MAESKAAEGSAEVPTHYFNGFNIAFGNADFDLILRLDNRETFHFKASYTVAKTLAEKMGNSIKIFEEMVGQPMLTTETSLQAIQRFNEKQSKPAVSGGPEKVK